MVKAIIREWGRKYYYIRNPKDHDGIYDLMMTITDEDHEISSDAASWCELARIGETYELREGYIELEEV